jgi:thiol-disulfide isomerase/thioredoxin
MNRFVIVGCLALSGLAVGGQVAGRAQSQPQDAKAPQASPAPPAPARGSQRQTSPASKALNEASAIKEIDSKIAAIRRVIADFPKTPQVDQGNLLLFDALIKKGDTAGAQAHAKAVVAAADELARPRILRDLAGTLLRDDVLLEDAESYAKSAVASLDQTRYVEARKKEAASRAALASRPAESAGDPAASATSAPAAGSSTPAASGSAAPPAGTIVATPSGGAPSSDEAYLVRFKGEKQSALSMLGQVYAKRGKTADAETALRDCYLLDKGTPAAATAALKLAEYAKAAGRDQEQLDYLERVALAGRLTPEASAELHAVYRKIHDGSLDGLEESLDARYEKDGPKPPEAKPYERAKDRTDRVVLAEIFTGSGCPPCVAADLAFEGAMHRYGPTDLAVLMYHLHIPRPDPMTNPTTQARSKYYGVSAVPTYVIDGKARTGGGSADSAADLFTRNVEPAIDTRLSVRPEVNLALTGSSTGQAVTATVSVSPGETKATRLRLQVVLVEEQIRYSGENGIRFHPMVVRSMAMDPTVAATSAAPIAAPASGPASGGGQAPKEGGAPAAEAPAKDTAPIPVTGFALEPGKARTVEYTFDLARVAADGLANLEDLEKHSTRFPNYTFVQKKNDVNPKRLALVAFVQDEDTRQILQAARVGVGK